METKTPKEDSSDEQSDCIVIDDLTVIGEKETINLLRANTGLFKDWKCAQPEEELIEKQRETRLENVENTKKLIKVYYDKLLFEFQSVDPSSREKFLSDEVKKITDEVRRLVTLVYVNTKLTEQGIRSFYTNILRKAPNVKTLEYDAHRSYKNKLKHTTIIDTVTKRVKSLLVNKSKFNDFGDFNNDDTPIPTKIKMNEFLNFYITIYVKKKNIIAVGSLSTSTCSEEKLLDHKIYEETKQKNEIITYHKTANVPEPATKSTWSKTPIMTITEKFVADNVPYTYDSSTTKLILNQNISELLATATINRPKTIMIYLSDRTWSFEPYLLDILYESTENTTIKTTKQALKNITVKVGVCTTTEQAITKRYKTGDSFVANIVLYIQDKRIENTVTNAKLIEKIVHMRFYELRIKKATDALSCRGEFFHKFYVNNDGGLINGRAMMLRIMALVCHISLEEFQKYNKIFMNTPLSSVHKMISHSDVVLNEYVLANYPENIFLKKAIVIADDIFLPDEMENFATSLFVELKLRISPEQDLNITVLTCKSESIIFRLYKLLSLWLSNYTAQITIDIYDKNARVCENGNNLAKEYGIDGAINFYCRDVLDIDIVSDPKKKDVYICWKRNVTNCFALKVFLCAFHIGRQPLLLLNGKINRTIVSTIRAAFEVYKSTDVIHDVVFAHFAEKNISYGRDTSKHNLYMVTEILNKKLTDLVTENEYLERHKCFSETLQHSINTSFSSILRDLVRSPLLGAVELCLAESKLEPKTFVFSFEQTRYSIPLWDTQAKQCMEELKLTTPTDVIGWLVFVTASAIARFFLDISIHLHRRIESIPPELSFHDAIEQAAKNSQIKWPHFASKHRKTDELIEKRTLLLDKMLGSFQVQHSSNEHNVQHSENKKLLVISCDISTLKKRNIFAPIKSSKVYGMESQYGLYSQDSYNGDNNVLENHEESFQAEFSKLDNIQPINDDCMVQNVNVTTIDKNNDTKYISNMYIPVFENDGMSIKTVTKSPKRKRKQKIERNCKELSDKTLQTSGGNLNADLDEVSYINKAAVKYVTLNIKISSFILSLQIPREYIASIKSEELNHTFLECNIFANSKYCLFRKNDSSQYHETFGKGFCGYIVAAQIRAEEFSPTIQLPVVLLQKFGEQLITELDVLDSVDYLIRTKVLSFLDVLHSNTAVDEKMLPREAWLSDNNLWVICQDKVNLFTSNRSKTASFSYDDNDNYLMYESRRPLSIGLRDIFDIIFSKNRNANVAVAANHFYFLPVGAKENENCNYISAIECILQWIREVKSGNIVKDVSVIDIKESDTVKQANDTTAEMKEVSLRALYDQEDVDLADLRLSPKTGCKRKEAYDDTEVDVEHRLKAKIVKDYVDSSFFSDSEMIGAPYHEISQNIEPSTKIIEKLSDSDFDSEIVQGWFRTYFDKYNWSELTNKNDRIMLYRDFKSEVNNNTPDKRKENIICSVSNERLVEILKLKIENWNHLHFKYKDMYKRKLFNAMMLKNNEETKTIMQELLLDYDEIIRDKFGEDESYKTFTEQESIDVFKMLRSKKNKDFALSEIIKRREIRAAFVKQHK